MNVANDSVVTEFANDENGQDEKFDAQMNKYIVINNFANLILPNYSHCYLIVSLLKRRYLFCVSLVTNVYQPSDEDEVKSKRVRPFEFLKKSVAACVKYIKALTRLIVQTMQSCNIA